jgi:signal transduction histidine kinase
MTKWKSIRWRLSASYAFIALLAAGSLGLVLYTILRGYYNRQEMQILQTRAAQIAFIASQLIAQDVPLQVIQDQSKSWSFFLQTRVRIEDETGQTLADSGVPADLQVVYFTSAQPFTLPLGTANPPNLGEKIELQIVEAAPADQPAEPGSVVFVSPEFVEVGIPADFITYGFFDRQTNAPMRRSSQSVEQTIIDEQGNPIGKVILSDGPAYGAEILDRVMDGWLVACLIAVLFAAFAGWLVSKRITNPLIRLTHVTSLMAHGNLSARVEIFGDDEISQLSRSFNEMAARVEDMVATLRSFVSDAAHELHTPLTALQANLELARDENSASERARYLDRAQEQGQRLETLVNSLLDLSRIEAANAQPDFEDVDVSRILKELAEHYASRAEQSNRIFELNLPDEQSMVYGNETQLRQVIVNLLDNAHKFTPAQGIISVSLENRLNDILLVIQDSGIGIPADDLPRLFSRFHRGRNAASFPGNGLGLAIVKAILSSHDGVIKVHSKPGEGTKIIVTIPSSQEKATRV